MYLLSRLAPVVSINDNEVETTELIDNDDDTCIPLPGWNGYRIDYVKHFYLLLSLNIGV